MQCFFLLFNAPVFQSPKFFFHLGVTEQMPIKKINSFIIFTYELHICYISTASVAHKRRAYLRFLKFFNNWFCVILLIAGFQT